MTDMNKEEYQFIVSIYKYNNSQLKWNYVEDGFAVIFDYKYPSLVINTKEISEDPDNKCYLDAIISGDFEFKCNTSDDHSGYTVTFDNVNSDEKIGIKFDLASSQAYAEFKSLLNKKKESKFQVLYYESFNLKYTGTYIDDEGVTGQGTELYDTPEKKIKYKGEFENNLYDGSGVFYSYDGNIELKVNNISRGNINGICTLTIHRNNKEDITKNFNYKTIKLDVGTGHNNFCESIARYFYNNLDDLFFEAFTLEEKLDEINRKLDLLLNKRSTNLTNLNKSNKGFLPKILGLFWDF